MEVDERIEQFEQEITNSINNAGLPLSIVDLVLERIIREVRDTKKRMREEAKARAEAEAAEAAAAKEEKEEASEDESEAEE